MHTFQVTRARLCNIVLMSFTACAAGVWSFCVQQSKNGFSSLPLIWYAVLVLAPLVAFACFVTMCRVKEGSGSWLFVGGLLVAPQLLVWVMAVDGVLHYLGIVNHGLFFG